MLKGVTLSLFIGQSSPDPAPAEVINALTRVQVSTGSDGPGGFQLEFGISNHSSLPSRLMVRSRHAAKAPPAWPVKIFVSASR